ncbi:hypothetical protein ZIOFF_046439 [Zingiber officinale]|uniref:Pentatricopeptide repeat-containing protein n=1 Tax=Zingiber officinale TaxID=94328 RepID=A0A8J5KNQ5_ZINOF|nr:hypothetical protein ZIOFF_046439 [Zingiber officinale]
MDLLFVPASFSPATLVVKPSVLLSPRASHKPPPEAAAAAAAPLSSATIRRPLNPPFRQTSPVEPDTAPSTALKPSTTNPLAPKLWLSSPSSPAVNPDSMADAAKYHSAVRGVEFDGVEFHGRVLTVMLDDGSQQRARKEEKMNWVAGSDRREYKSKLHAETGNASNRFVKVLDTKPEDWQAVVSAFDKIPKLLTYMIQPSLGDYLLMVKYYARRGDKHHARATFESMRARGIEPDERIFTSLVHAYAVARDMLGALSCVDEMKTEGVELTLSADIYFKEAKQKFSSLNGVIYSNIIYAHCQSDNMSQAEVLVREMEEQGMDVSINIYHTMMDGYTNIRDEKKCLIVVDRLKVTKHSVYLYSNSWNFYFFFSCFWSEDLESIDISCIRMHFLLQFACVAPLASPYSLAVCSS